jgi:hypothetical protein
MSKSMRAMALVGLLAGGLLLAETSKAQAQWGYGGNNVTIGRPGGFNVTIGQGYPNYGYGYGGYAPGYSYAPRYGYAPGAVTYGRGYTSYAAPAPAWGGYTYPNYGVTSYRVAPGVRYNAYSYPAYGYSNYRYAPRSYYRRW